MPFFFLWHVVGSVSDDCYITRQHGRPDLRCLRFSVIYTTRNIQGQAIEAWRHSFSHKLGGNVLSPVIAISPDRTVVSSRRVVSFSGDSHSPETNTRAQAMAA